jgi:hypothetical protein
MSKYAGWKDMGIEDEDLFTLKGLPFWQTVETSRLLRGIVSELGQEEQVLRAYIKLIEDRTDFATIKITEEMTGTFILGVLSSKTQKIYQILELIREYANFLDNKSNEIIESSD